MLVVGSLSKFVGTIRSGIQIGSRPRSIRAIADQVEILGSLVQITSAAGKALGIPAVYLAEADQHMTLHVPTIALVVPPDVGIELLAGIFTLVGPGFLPEIRELFVGDNRSVPERHRVVIHLAVRRIDNILTVTFGVFLVEFQFSTGIVVSSGRIVGEVGDSATGHQTGVTGGIGAVIVIYADNSLRVVPVMGNRMDVPVVIVQFVIIITVDDFGRFLCSLFIVLGTLVEGPSGHIQVNAGKHRVGSAAVGVLGHRGLNLRDKALGVDGRKCRRIGQVLDDLLVDAGHTGKACSIIDIEGGHKREGTEITDQAEVCPGSPELGDIDRIVNLSFGHVRSLGRSVNDEVGGFDDKPSCAPSHVDHSITRGDFKNVQFAGKSLVALGVRRQIVTHHARRPACVVEGATADLVPQHAESTLKVTGVGERAVCQHLTLRGLFKDLVTRSDSESEGKRQKDI